MKTIIFLTLISGLTMASDWPSYQHDNLRSGITADQLNAPTLSQSWIFTAKARPQPAWHGKMERDSYAKRSFQADTYDYDKAFNLIAADGKVFFGSTSGNACVALNDTTGTEVWRAPAISAVRVAPAFDSSKIYFGSDDGHAYCVNASTGALIWKYRGGASDTMIASDHKFISRTPCRTGVLIDAGNAYCGFGLMSWHTNIMAQLDATTGAETNKVTQSGAGYSFEGLLLSDGTDLFVTQGRNAPASFKLGSSLTLNGKLPGCGGTFATISSTGNIFHGPGHRGARADHMQESTASSRSSVGRLNFVNRILVHGSNRYSLIRDAVQATGSQSWTQGIESPVTMILGGTTLYIGAKNQVVAIDTTTGNVLKILPIDGTAYSLAIANNKLFASTTTGKIYCFN